ncbi:hypothetical protein CARUB_v10011457mg [Capsella rubella]|uniref:F-box domain-containing protein n=1 Tax=Capsella rubella TaxID=81985 RepID=R0IHH6_9BRAS|nr:putative F-box protein At1g47390 [Capsella rubella]EOA37860.1 hypothetical protein CARUB_v10011457mg [Capsella rubella]
MAHEDTLPYDLIEETLSRVPPKSLVRFRAVSKQWNTLIDDKTFINNHKTTFRFILATKSKFYSVSITPKIQVRELTLDIPGFESYIPKTFFECNGFLGCGMDYKGVVLLNPWLRQTRWIELVKANQRVTCNGIGYEYGNGSLLENGYKTLLCCYKDPELTNKVWQIHDFASNEVKDSMLKAVGSSEAEKSVYLQSTSVSLNGTLYWVASYQMNDSSMFLLSFNFSVEKFDKLSDLPVPYRDNRDILVLSLYKGDRFSLLKQCHLTKKIEIWVTKNVVTRNWRGGDGEWMNFMEVSTPNLPDLLRPSYFIDGKKLVVCSCDGTGQAWIYVMGDKKLITKTQIDPMVDLWPLHCAYFPSLVSVPRGQREEAGALQV